MLDSINIPQYILDRFEKEVGVKVSGTESIQVGMNNRLFKLTTPKGKYLLKIYSNDNEDRIKREYPALSYLPTVGFTEVPKGIMVDYENEWAIYTFMEGVRKTSQELTRDDLMEIAHYVNKLQKLTPSKDNSHILGAHMACFAIQDYLNNISMRLNEYKKTIEEEGANTILKEFDDKYQPERVINESIKRILKKGNRSQREEIVSCRFWITQHVV
jgi:hypothetical protein